MRHGEFGAEALPAGLIVVGAVGAPNGVRGASRIWSYTDPPENLFDYDGWRLGRAGNRNEQDWLPADVEDARWHGNGFVGRLAGCTSREAAAALTNLLIAVPESALPPVSEDEVYWKDLLGMQAETTAGLLLGCVERLLETGANDVLCLRDEQGRERLVPWVDSVVVKIDRQARRLTLDWDAEF